MTRQNAILLAVLVVTCGCSGIVGGPGEGPEGSGPNGGGHGAGNDGPPVVAGEDGEPAVVSCDGPATTGATSIYRLTERQYENTVRELMGMDTVNVTLTADEDDAPSALAVQKWNEAAAALAPGQSSWMDGYVGCQLGTSNTACAQEFVQKFAERAFRHPLTTDETTWLTAAWNAVPDGSTQSERLGFMVQAVLQAPEFLYFYAAGVADDAAANGTLRLTSYEMAQRLSYFLWDSLPDDELLAAAAAGQLDTKDGVVAQATRMLDDDRSKPVLRAYLTTWLDMDGKHISSPVDVVTKDPERFPGTPAEIGSYMRTEMDAFMDYVMFEKDGSLESLLMDTRAYVNGPLAKIYGITGGPTSASDWQWVDLDPKQRAGVLTRAGFLAVQASATDSSPIRRGVFIMRGMLCQPPSPPPPNVNNTPVQGADPDNTTVPSVRDKTEALTADPFCAACHKEINGMGFAFEHYDALGQWQGDTENWSGAAINSKGALARAGLANGPVDDAIDLSAKLLETDWLRECAAEQWFEQAVRRSPVPLDACSLQQVRQDVGKPGSLRTLLLSFVASDAFRYINHGE